MNYRKTAIGLLALLLLVWACTGDHDKHPKDVAGTITSFTKNGISRMDTIQKYFPDTKFELRFGESTSGALTSQVYPFRLYTFYQLDGTTYDTPIQGGGCTMGGPQFGLITSATEIKWYAYSYPQECFVTFVDGSSACDWLSWQFMRVGKKGNFDLEHTTEQGDVYKLEFR